MLAPMYQIENAARCAMGDALHEESASRVVRPVGGTATWLQNAAIMFLAIAAVVFALNLS